MTGFNIRKESNIHESMLFGFLRSSDDVIAINICILYAKHVKDENKNREFNVDFPGYLYHLKYILKIEKSICNRKKSNSEV